MNTYTHSASTRPNLLLDLVHARKAAHALQHRAWRLGRGGHRLLQVHMVCMCYVMLLCYVLLCYVMLLWPGWSPPSAGAQVKHVWWVGAGLCMRAWVNTSARVQVCERLCVHACVVGGCGGVHVCWFNASASAQVCEHRSVRAHALGLRLACARARAPAHTHTHTQPVHIRVSD